MRALLETEFERIRKHYLEQEKVLEREVAKLEQSYEWEIKQSEKEGKDEEDYPVAEWWDVQSDYQPTEYGNDGGRYFIRELPVGQPLQRSINLHSK